MRTLRILALATLLPTVALAEREITPLAGYRQGTVEFSTGIGCIALDGVRCPFFAKSEESAALGFLVDLPIGDRLDVELLLNRQATELFFHDGLGEVPRGPGNGRSGFDVTHLHAGLRRSWEFGRFEPFGAFGAGFSRLESDPLFNGSIGVTRFSGSLAGGARVGLSDRLGLRLEARAYEVDLPDEMGPFMTRLSSESFGQTELTAGLAVRF